MNKFVTGLLAALTLGSCAAASASTPSDYYAVVRYGATQPLEAYIVRRDHVAISGSCVYISGLTVNNKPFEATLYGDVSVFKIPDYKGQESAEVAILGIGAKPEEVQHPAQEM